jgi:cycloeucalenol cycloisomerase
VTETSAAGVLASPARASRGRWLSSNPSKAWGERFFLLYTPVWMTGMGLMMKTGVAGSWGDAAQIAAQLALWLPLLGLPLLLHDERALGRRWFETYAFKAFLWLGIFSFVGSYFGSEYFFDVLGMVYRFTSLDMTFDSALVGSGAQKVPLILYFSAHFYFVTYHTAAVVVMRRVRTSSLYVHPLVWPVVILACAYGFAWAETFFMTDASIAQQFTYRDVPRMLRWGSLFYALYFVVSFPMFYRLDEQPGESWTLRRVAVEALAAGMAVLFLLDFAAAAIGRL